MLVKLKLCTAVNEKCFTLFLYYEFEGQMVEQLMQVMLEVHSILVLMVLFLLFCDCMYDDWKAGFSIFYAWNQTKLYVDVLTNGK